MREIKFRAWQPHPSLQRKPGMYEVESLEFYPQHGGGEAFIKDSGSKQAKSSEFFDDIVLMQYTGLKDKNGVEIYEGDILAFYSTDGQRVTKRQTVKWEPSKLGFNFSQKPTVEVIGNIYENPELLEGKE